MKLYIPSTSRSDRRNTDALKRSARDRGHQVVARPIEASVALLLGDRSEMLTCARECIEHYVPWVHVGAGCVTRGSWDQTVREMLTAGGARLWAYTSEAAWVVREEYGNDDEFGIPLLDTLAPRGLTRQDYALVAINPVTAQCIGEELELVYEIAKACREVGRRVVWTRPNEDRQGVALLSRLADVWPDGYLRVPFADALEECAVLVGNSSAALIEAPVLGTRHVDCGCRQDGRPLAHGLRGDGITRGVHDALECGPGIFKESPYRHPKRAACASIIELAEELADA